MTDGELPTPTDARPAPPTNYSEATTAVSDSVAEHPRDPADTRPGPIDDVERPGRDPTLPASSAESVPPGRPLADEIGRVLANPDTAFERLFTGNDLVCPRCYARMKARRQVPAEIYDRRARGGSMARHELTWVDKRDAEHYHHDDPSAFDDGPHYFVTDALHGRRSREPTGPYTPSRTTYACTSCGELDPDPVDETRSKRALADVAKNVSHTLAEYGIENDSEILVETALTARSAGQARDDQSVLARATAEAIRTVKTSRRLGILDQIAIPNPQDGYSTPGSTTNSQRRP